MDERIASGIWFAVLAYLSLGAVCFAWLMLGGLKRIDPLAAQAPLRVKVLIAPGLIALWPLALLRSAGFAPPEDRR